MVRDDLAVLHLHELRVADDAGVVDEHVHAAPGLDDVREAASTEAAVGHVHLAERGGVPEWVSRRRGVALGASTSQMATRSPWPANFCDGGAADAGGAAGDDDDS